MTKKDPRVDAFIDNAGKFARPILRHLRALVHEVSPEATETIKWGMPVFEYKGILCGMGAFKHHCTFFLWKPGLINDPHGVLQKEKTEMGQFGKIATVNDLPADKYILDILRQATLLNERGITGAKKPSTKKKKPPIIPPFFRAALKKHKKALLLFEKLSDSHKGEYCEWIAEAKRAETRDKRIATAIEWISKGKSRNWKYGR